MCRWKNTELRRESPKENAADIADVNSSDPVTDLPMKPKSSNQHLQRTMEGRKVEEEKAPNKDKEISEGKGEWFNALMKNNEQFKEAHAERIHR